MEPFLFTDGEISLMASCGLRFLSLVVLALPTAAFAQELNWAEKMFEQRSLDFGVVARGAECKTQLKIRNIYQEAIHITNVSTSCGCSAAKKIVNQIPSGEEAYVEISMDTVRFMREKTSSALITLSEPTKGLVKEVKIPLRVYIRTDVVFTPGSVIFGAVDVGAGAERKIRLDYAGRADWQVKSVKSPKPYLTAQAVETARSGGTVNYDVIVTLAPNTPAGLIREELTLITDDQANPNVPLPVEARVEADITIQPEELALGTVTAGQSKTLNLVIRGKKPFKIEKIECDRAENPFKMRLPVDEKTVHVVPFTFTAPEEAGAVQDRFTVTVAGRPEPLYFKATGKVITSGPTPNTK
jgi:hypothetical protein